MLGYLVVIKIKGFCWLKIMLLFHKVKFQLSELSAAVKGESVSARFVHNLCLLQYNSDKGQNTDSS